MKKMVIVMLASCVLLPLYAKVESSDMTPQERKAAFMRIMGGFVKDERKMKGQVVIVNAQNEVSVDWLKSAAAIFAKDVQISVKVVQGSFELKNPKLHGQATVFVVNDPGMPMSLNAPESRWSMVNVAPLKTEKIAFFKARVERSVVRGIVPLLCGSDSQYPLCLMGAVHKPEDLDRFINARLPVDVIDRFRKNFDALGLGAWSMTTYRTAAKQGWAPPPTNDLQKAILQKVRSEKERGPANPIEIPMPKRK